MQFLGRYDFIQNMDRFETYWHNLMTNLMDIFYNLRTDMIDFICREWLQ